MPFVFKPSMAGRYSEELKIGNVLDDRSSQIVMLKATVRDLPTFSLDTTTLEYGVITPGQVCDAGLGLTHC